MLSSTFIVREVNAWFQSFKGQADSPLGANEAGVFNLNTRPIYHSKNPRNFENDTKSTLPVLHKLNME